jgi:hypothetical protein
MITWTTSVRIFHIRVDDYVSSPIQSDNLIFKKPLHVETTAGHHHKAEPTQTPWPESVSEQYRPSDRRLSAKLEKTYSDIGCHVVSATDLFCRILGLLDRSSYIFFQVAPQLYSRG